MAERALGYRTQTSATSKAPPEVVFDTIADLRNHLVWSDERASDTFHDRSVVTTVSRLGHRYDIRPEGEGRGSGTPRRLRG